MPNMIKLQSSDGVIFNTDVQAAKCSGIIKTMLMNFDTKDEDAVNSIVPLPNVHSKILSKVLIWAEYHMDDVQLMDNEENEHLHCDDISPWDEDFVKLDHGTLFELTKAASYLDIKGLFELTCKTVANMLKDKTAQQIRQTFNIQNDFSPAEEKKVREENKWLEE